MKPRNTTTSKVVGIKELDPIIFYLPLSTTTTEVNNINSNSNISNRTADNTDTTTNGNNNATTVRVFQLTINNITIEVSSWGASLTRFCVPKIISSSTATTDTIYTTTGTTTENVNDSSIDNNNIEYDDIVLGYQSIYDLIHSKNPYYFNVTVGPVANRIKDCQFTLNNNTSTNNNTTYKLDCNNIPNNHLHGGVNGLSYQNWNVCNIEYNDTTNTNNIASVTFQIISNESETNTTTNTNRYTNDYPGTVQYTAKYSLQSCKSTNENDDTDRTTIVQLHVQYNATLLLPNITTINDTTNQQQQQSQSQEQDEQEQSQQSQSQQLLVSVSTPVNIANHTYFNIAGHNHTNGILDHTIRLNCSSYTPLDSITSIPTNYVVPCIDENHTCMDLTNKQHKLQDAIDRLKNKVLQEISTQAVDQQQEQEQPYGFDHNYIIDNNNDNNNNNSCDEMKMNLVSVVQYKSRRLTVRASTPGVQLYTANYLNGSNSNNDPIPFKDNATYNQWQGLCLETQHYPNSINVDESLYPDFAKGRCVILSSTNRSYQHNIEYTFEQQQSTPKTNRTIQHSTTTTTTTTTTTVQPNSNTKFTGTDTLGHRYDTIADVWSSTTRDEWYNRAAVYYEDNCDESIDGVLGGYGSISDIDINGSYQFIIDIQCTVRPSFLRWSNNNNNNKIIACECGAGIGRITKHLFFCDKTITKHNNNYTIDICHLIESSSRLLSYAPNYIGDPIASTKCKYYCIGLQDWIPKINTYSIIWIQWVLIYIRDDDIIQLLQHCANALVDDGLIIIKENTTNTNTDSDTNTIVDDFQVDVADASITRSVRYWKYLFHCANLSIVYEKQQSNFPSELYPVSMFALEKKEKKRNIKSTWYIM